MAKFLTIILVAWAIVAVANGSYHPMAPVKSPGGPSPSSSPSLDCTTLIYKMSDCLEFLLVGGSDNKPEDSCCVGFQQVVNIDAKCICKGLKSSAVMGFDIDMKKAATLPYACGVEAPSLSNCMMSSTLPSPGASPVTSQPPKASPPHVPTPPPTASHPTPPSRLVPSGVAAAPVNQAPAPSPSNSGAITIPSTFLVPLTMVVSAAIGYYL